MSILEMPPPAVPAAPAVRLRGIDRNARVGDMTLLIGPSGYGKATLISVTAGPLAPTAGDLSVLSTDLAVLPRREPARPAAPAVRCRGVTKEFGAGDARTVALRGIDLDVQAGEMTLLAGPSGCGKTTLISIIAGLLNPTAGEVSVLGTDLAALSRREQALFRARHIGFVFQQYNLLPALTAVENAAVPLLIAGLGRREALARAAAVLEEVGLGGRLRARPSQLSGGQQQRVALARAVVHEPRLLVCDEPTAALDAQAGQTVMRLLRRVAVQPGRAVLVVTHDSRVFDFGDRIVHMSDGRIERVADKEGGV